MVVPDTLPSPVNHRFHPRTGVGPYLSLEDWSVTGDKGIGNDLIGHYQGRETVTHVRQVKSGGVN